MLRLLRLLALAPCFFIANADESAWVSLFDGESLEGWTIKVAKHPIGENYANTFQVEDGVIKVSYEDYDAFDMQVAHLYTNQPYSHYRLRLEYQFVEGHCDDAPFWAKRNSGVMLHSQSPLSMQFDQAFPVSLEAQFLAVETEAGTQTGNIATPGTHVTIDGTLKTEHIIDSTSKLFPLGEWIRFEAEVPGNEELVYYINGEEVNRFQSPTLDASDPDAKRLLDSGATESVRFGHIALQAEGQQIWFRNIEIKPLAPER